MKRRLPNSSRLSSMVLMAAVVLVAGAAAAPGDAQAGLRVRATVIADPLRATVVLGDGPGLCTIPAPREHRRVVVRGHRHDRDCDRGVIVVEGKGKHHRRHHRQDRVWVPGHWEQVSARTARWIPGHWEHRSAHRGCRR